MQTDNSERKRRSDRYKSASGVAPSSEMMEREEKVKFVSAVSSASKVPVNNRYVQPKKQPSNDSKGKVNKLPQAFVWVLSLLIIGVLAVFSASWLMTAYLDKQENERQLAHQKIVDAHPIYYKDIIEEYSAEYNLNPAYVCSIVLNESSFRQDAESGVGARGLMQVMPDTGEWIAGKLGMRNFQPDTLYQPEVNVQFGCWYLNYLAKTFAGDPVLVTAAYHTGQGQVKSWLQDKTMSQDGFSIPVELLPEGPTKKYVKRVTSDYGIYKALFYTDEDSGSNDSSIASLPDN